MRNKENPFYNQQSAIVLKTHNIYLQNELSSLKSSYTHRLGVLIFSFFKKPYLILISPLLILKYLIDLFLSVIKRKILPIVYRYINKHYPSNKIAFGLNLGLVGGTERVFQMHTRFASDKYECEVIFHQAKGPIADDLRKDFKIKEGKVLSYKMLRYKYIYLAQIFPNIRFIKECNPDCRISFILHEHLSGWLETFQNSPDTILFDHIFCISNLVKDKFLEKVPWYPENRVSVLYNPFFNGNEDLSIIEKREVKPENFVLGYLGRVSPEKNTVGIVRIFKEFNKLMPNTKLVIAGPIHEHIPEYKELFLKEIKGCQNINYIGPISGEGQPTSKEFFGMIDGLAFPSFIEGIPLTATEAMSFGLPVISTNVGAMSEIIKLNETGMLVSIDPIEFNPFAELKPPFKSLTDKDEKAYVKALIEFVKFKWDSKEIAKFAIDTFGTKSAKHRFIRSVEKILSEDSIKIT